MFHTIKKNVQDQFTKMTKGNPTLFYVDVAKNELFDAYINALPDDEKASHICNCCRQFINNYGNIVTIKNGKLQTLWDFENVAPYDKVPSALSGIIRAKAIDGLFLSKIANLGTNFNHQQLGTGEVIRWDHFYINLPASYVTRSHLSIESIMGTHRATKDVFQRSLDTLTEESITTVLDLIAQNQLYRGKEFEASLKKFQVHKNKYMKLRSTTEKSLFVWDNFVEGGRIRNTAIGSLLVNLSDGMPVEGAVRAFESMVAPANYKRPTAVVTEKMIKQAQEKIAELGISESLHRRHATEKDIPIDHLLYVHRMSNTVSVFDSLIADAPVNTKSFAKAKEVSLDSFIAEILPTATSVEILLENDNAFMSLIAPEYSDAKNILAWDNPISWTYQNNLTDVIKEKVKNAGGDVNGELRISLEWFNHDDLDLHVMEPNKNTIYFGSKRSNSGGCLDVDMHVGRGTTRTPVENITFNNLRTIQEGTYTVTVNNYCKRENNDFGFNLQIECQGNVIDLAHPKAIANGARITAVTFNYKKDKGISNLKTTLESSRTQKEVNNVLTSRFQTVNMITYSPNHWTNQIGNKHVFFIIKGAKVDIPLRPFFNEFLSQEMQENRKVFELISGKMMVNPTNDQLTGVGFSLTQKTQFITRVNNVVYKVNI